VKRASRALCTASVLASFLVPSELTLAADGSTAAQAPGAPKPDASSVITTTERDPEQATSSEQAASSEPTSSSDQAAADAYQQALAVYVKGDVKGAFANMRES